MPDAKQYADRDHMAQGDYYLRHISAMTGEGLQLKSEIAGELAHRDMVIDAQAAEIERLRALHAQACDMYDRKNPSGCVCKIDPVADEVTSTCALHREMAKDAERYRWLLRKFCFTGNGDGTCSMHAINLPCRVPGWPEPGGVAEFCAAAIDAAMGGE